MHTLFKINPASSSADYEAVWLLFQAYASSLGVDLSYQDFSTELATLPGKYAPPEGALLLARDETGKAIGCVAMRKFKGDICEMKRLYVAPAARGTGLGKALAEAILNEAKRIGYREMWLDSLPSMHEAIALYRKLGFIDIPPYYDTPIKGTVFLGKSLNLVA